MIQVPETRKFWLSVLNDLKSRGVLDVYLFCTDGLCGMMEAIHAVYPKSRLQRCIIHQIRSSTRFVSWKENRDVLSTFYEYPPEIRKIIYTTNIIEGLNRQFRQITKNKPSFTNDDSLRRMLYLASRRPGRHSRRKRRAYRPVRRDE